MVDNLADVVDNLDVGDNNDDGNTGTDGQKPATKGSGSGVGDSGDGTGQSSNNGSDKGETGDGQSGDGKGDSGANDADTGDDTGYIADEVDEGDEPATKTEAKAEEIPADLPPELKYVVDRLPNLNVRGKDGKNYQIKAAGQLPEDFEFATKRDELMFNQAIAGQELKAQQLLGEFNTKRQQDTANQYSAQENEDIRHDIGDLQREGALARFRYAPTDSKFTADPAVKTAQEVMEYMNEKNDAYAKAGRLYRISFRDAFEQMSEKGQIKTTEEDKGQAREDRERKVVSRRTGGGKGTASSSKPTVRIAPSMDDLISRIDSMDI